MGWLGFLTNGDIKAKESNVPVSVDFTAAPRAPSPPVKAPP